LTEDPGATTISRMMCRKVSAKGWILLVGLMGLISPPAGGTEVAEPGGPLDLRVETLRVGPGGTETLASDEARLLPGKAALLVKELTLSSPSSRKKGSETLAFRAEIRVDQASGSRLMMKVVSRVNVLATTGGIPIPKEEIHREATAASAEGTSQLFEVYASPALDTKVILNIRWFPVEKSSGGEEDQVPIPLTARVFELEAGESILLNEAQLLAAPGGTAGATFNRIVPLQGEKEKGKRVRQDRVELSLSPRLQVGKSLRLTLDASGEVTTVTEDGNLSHPLKHEEDLLLSPGIPATVELEIAADDPGKEGWERVRFRLEILASF
jgi:hypothetical protein